MEPNLQAKKYVFATIPRFDASFQASKGKLRTDILILELAGSIFSVLVWIERGRCTVSWGLMVSAGGFCCVCYVWFGVQGVLMAMASLPATTRYLFERGKDLAASR
jgi:hypothetical protein